MSYLHALAERYRRTGSFIYECSRPFGRGYMSVRVRVQDGAYYVAEVSDPDHVPLPQQNHELMVELAKRESYSWDLVLRYAADMEGRP